MNIGSYLIPSLPPHESMPPNPERFYMVLLRPHSAIQLLTSNPLIIFIDAGEEFMDMH